MPTTTSGTLVKKQITRRFCTKDNYDTCPAFYRAERPVGDRHFLLFDETEPHRGQVVLSKDEVAALALGGSDTVTVEHSDNGVVISTADSGRITILAEQFEDLVSAVNDGTALDALEKELASV